MDMQKYPRTPHLPWSEGATSDDKILKSINHFIGQEVVVTEKLDGENTSIYSDGKTHARSLSSASHPSRNWVRQLAAEIAYKIPSNIQIVGENLYAKHSIYYSQLPSYFICYGAFIENEGHPCEECNGDRGKIIVRYQTGAGGESEYWEGCRLCNETGKQNNQISALDWDSIDSLCKTLNIEIAPILYRGIWNEKIIKKLYPRTSSFGDISEGYVVRTVSSFRKTNFDNHVAKFVRKGHVTTDEHWMHGQIVPNKLK